MLNVFDAISMGFSCISSLQASGKIPLYVIFNLTTKVTQCSIGLLWFGLVISCFDLMKFFFFKRLAWD